MPKQGYKRLSYEDRKQIEQMLSDGLPVSFIANTLNKTHQAIYHELKRCKSCSDYNADYAQQDYVTRNEGNGRTPLLEIDKALAQRISKLIQEDSLSPSDIVIRLREENCTHIPLSRNTIYAAIDKGLIPNVTRETLLLKRKKTHMFSNGLIKIPRWICDKLDLRDGEDLDIDISDEGIIIKKSKKND